MTIISNETNKSKYEAMNFESNKKFFKRFKIATLLRKSNGTKEKGVPANEILGFLVGLIFSGKNFYRFLATESEKVSFSKNTVYRFLSNARVNWERFLFLVVTSVLPEIRRLTSEARNTVLIVDDSPYYRNRSKKTELLSRCYDHVEHKFYKGFNLLTIGWSDGQSFLPVKFSLVASNDENNRYQEAIKHDSRSLAGKRRKNAKTDKPNLLLGMLRDIRGTAAQAKYVLFDSWFSSPSAIINIKKLGYDIVARLKNSDKLHYIYEGNNLPISKIYSKNRKRRGRSKYLLSVLVDVKNSKKEQIPAKIVFVKDRNNSKKWIAFISTDTNLSEDDIITMYGKRWDIEVFFKVIKSLLGLAKEFACNSFDAITAHTTIVFVRYIMLSIENRENKDDRSLCELFYVMCKELEDLSFQFSFNLIMTSLIQCTNDFFVISSEQLNEFIEYFLACLPNRFKCFEDVGVWES